MREASFRSALGLREMNLRACIRTRVLVTCLGGLMTACAPQTQEQVFRSPSGTYEARLYGVFGRPLNPFSVARVSASVSKHGTPFADMGAVFDTDSFDAPFREYDRKFWAKPNVFRITGGAKDDLYDEVSVSNQSGSTLRCLSLRVGDVLLVVDVPDHGKVETTITPQAGGDDLYVVAKALLEAGRVLERSENLRPAPDLTQKNRIAVTISSSSLYMGLTVSTR